MDLTSQKKALLQYPDQDVLNMLFDNNYKKLSPNYNVQTWSIPTEKPDNLAWQQVVSNPYIIHFSARSKPWQRQNVPYEWEFWKYAKQTAFYEDILLMFLKENLKK